MTLSSQLLRGSESGTPASSRLTLRREDVAALVILMLCMAVVYVPWERAPFELLDFPGYFKMLREAPSPASGFRAIHENMALQNDGRFIPGYIANVVLKWTLLGERLVAWQLWRFAEICTGVLLAFLLARRLGATLIGALGAATIMAFAGNTFNGYLKLQVVEPAGSLLVLTAALLATSYQTTTHPRLVAVLTAVFLGLALWMRETFVACIPFVVLLALSWTGRQFQRPGFTRRNVELVAITLAIVAVAILPILMVRQGSVAAEKYSGNYRLAAIKISNISNIAKAVFLPVTRVVWFPANLAFLGVVAGGWLLAFRYGDRPATLTRLVVLLSLPISGIAVFAPWPFFNGYYGFTLMLGSALLLATALTSLQRHARRSTLAAALAACALVPLYGSIDATRGRRETRAQSIVDDEVVRYLASNARHSPIMAAVPSTDPRRPFNSVTLLWSAYLINPQWLVGAPDISCADAADQLRTGQRETVLVVYTKLCPGVAPAGARPAKTARRIFRYRNWKTFAPEVDSVRADIWGPR